MGFLKRILLPLALFLGVSVGLVASAVYQPHLAELFVGELPQMIIPTAMGIGILWRTGVLERRLNGRIDELKEGYVAMGKEAGFKEATVMGREDRKEVVSALLTPSPMQPVAQQPPPQQPPPPKKEK